MTALLTKLAAHAPPAHGERAARARLRIDLSDLALDADLSSLDQLALVMAHVYERFVPFADEGWEWVVFPGSPHFNGWVYSERAERRIIAAARLLSKRAAPEGPAGRTTHGVSAYRTRQLTGRSWTAEPGSKLWRSIR